MESTRSYRLAAGVRARKEEFGLLFYRSLDAKLTFVNSGDLLETGTAPDGAKLVRPVGGQEQSTKLLRLFSALLRKGLVLESQGVDP